MNIEKRLMTSTTFHDRCSVQAKEQADDEVFYFSGSHGRIRRIQ
jgi:hypothetical protein